MDKCQEVKGMYPRSEILFPHRCVKTLQRLRGFEWRALVRKVATLPETHVDALAFSLMMIRLTKCLNCDLGSYKASLGYCACARRAINSFKGTDGQLLHRFEATKQDLLEYLDATGTDIAALMRQPEAMRVPV
jgi:hypothetical protein